MDNNFLESLFIQQNKLLEQTNKLIESQNSLLQKNLINSSFSHDDEFVENLWQDEMRGGFLVTSHRKRLWNAQIGLINEFARICNKHNIRWFIYGGTLLGAVRHKGFIPWDNDVDVAMLRPDYEKFRKVVTEEIREPYFFDPWYNHKLESDEVNGIRNEENLPRIPIKLQQRLPFGWPFWPILRIKDSRTTYIARQGQRDMPQSIFLDIFPFDPVPPFANQKQATIFEAASLLFFATIVPWLIVQHINKNANFVIPKEELQKFIKMPFKARALRWEKFMGDNFFSSQYVSQIRNVRVHNPKMIFNVKDFDDIVYVPFEKIQFPIPSGYDDILTASYGNWHEPQIFDPHYSDCSCDVPYKEYAQKSRFMN